MSRAPVPPPEPHAPRWQRRPPGAASRWYTVERDTNGVFWLVAGDTDRLRLDPGMQLDVAQIAWQRGIAPHD